MLFEDTGQKETKTVDGAKSVKGYKIFEADWSCLHKQYTCPGKFEEDVNLKLCEKGMHFCKNLMDCFRYYGFNSNYHIAKVVAYGDVIEAAHKCCTNKLEIIKEIPMTEICETFKTSKYNYANNEMHNYNIGDFNAGSYNSGDYNIGDWNSGTRNIGTDNSGDNNLGQSNNGSNNTGFKNDGCLNNGSYNKGHCNYGNFNKGDYNYGNNNSGNNNLGSSNSGNYNLGSFNSGNYNLGFFNTISSQTKIWFFNKPSELTYGDWCSSRAFEILHKSGFDLYNRGHNQFVWDSLSYADKKIIMSIPNFDKEIFKEITGIDVDYKNKDV